MITEGLCLAVVRTIRGQRWTMTQKWNLDDSPGATPKTQQSSHEDAIPPGRLIRFLLPEYALDEIHAAIEWLEIGGYLGSTGWGMLAPRQLLTLTQKGIAFADSGRLDAEERRFVYQEDPYAAFVARQFADVDVPLYTVLAEEVLRHIGVKVFDGRVDGIEAFRGEILRKIRLARFFVCILTKRSELTAGGFASSVWLYQEAGAAVALGKKPLILVEDGLDSHYAGELQKNYEYIPFNRSDFGTRFTEVARRIGSDWESHGILFPGATAT